MGLFALRGFVLVVQNIIHKVQRDDLAWACLPCVALSWLLQSSFVRSGMLSLCALPAVRQCYGRGLHICIYQLLIRLSEFLTLRSSSYWYWPDGHQSCMHVIACHQLRLLQETAYTAARRPSPACGAHKEACLFSFSVLASVGKGEFFLFCEHLK